MSEQRTAAVVLVGTVALCLVGAPALAEVMDKEPTVPEMWMTSVFLGIVGAAAWLWKWPVGLFVSLVTVLFAWDLHSELTDPFVGKDILQEAGTEYVRHAYSSIAVGLVSQVAAVVFCLTRGRSRVPPGEPA